MSYLFHIDVSPNGDYSYSKKLGAKFVETYKTANPDVPVVVRDLNTNPAPHLTGEAITAFYTSEESRSPAQAEKAKYRLDLIKEIVDAKAIVVSTPMWNWSTPSVLKAYLDQIILPGVLDPYSNAKLAGKPISIYIAAGGGYTEGSGHPESDFESNYLKLIFSKLGATDITITRAELTLAGVVPGMESLVDAKKASFDAAEAAAIARAQSI
eukprot:CAMPEP_0196761540 /NCGR_PEP_ID=MMETSP1095-20130614/812_1 /TAXON_ID=96789 ORGANISM="Chromulina nebulosa, Strain UTEXLB2642" /NCGR_SAMPLE_ID=MMETSP1095 /ASSEMBLY_ACC=CAM_ASM_000446 /LENGTH=210 /DNA_ID=CAMNT_0042111217 /DNA_START=65 /DNA_END=697 /DNA_ORIENTATION=+